MRPPVRGGRRLAVIVTASLAVSGVGVAAVPAAMAADQPGPASVGVWSAPFVEGGMDSPRCETVGAGTALERVSCKPAASLIAVLPDGRVLYGNGATGGGAPVDGPYEDRSRTVDLTAPEPAWDVPENGAADDPQLVSGCAGGSPAGVTGAPGRAGEGLVGSVVGQTGLETESCPSGANADVFAGDIVQLADGRQLLVGGADSSGGDGLRGARVFDWEAGDNGLGRWEPVGSMKFPRFNPAATTLPDGSVAVVSGTAKLLPNTQLSQVRRVETYDPATGKWTENYGGLASEKSLPQNPRVYLAPNGKLFYTGDGQMLGAGGVAADQALFAEQGFFDFDTNEWTNAGFTVPRSSPASVALPMKAPYDTMTILRAGGTLGPPPGSVAAVPTTDLTTIKADGSVQNIAGPELRAARWFSQPTPLPTGEVLLTSGARNDAVALPGGGLPVKLAELFDPVTNRFYEVASPQQVRTYHNSAVLLPNGQVLVGGNAPADLGYGPSRDLAPGITANTEDDPSFEVYSPPYLFRGDRPRISEVQSGLAWGENFALITDDASDVQKITLMRLPASQHVMDNDTRTLELAFTQTGSRSLSVDMPQDGVAAPPGYYYLFINKKAQDFGKAFVPSVARIVKVGAEVDKSPAPEPMSEDSLIGVDPALLDPQTAPAPVEEPAAEESDTAPAAGPAGLPLPAAPAPDSVVPGGPAAPSPDAVPAPDAPQDPTGALPAGDPAALLPVRSPSGSGRRAKRPRTR